MSMQKVNHYAHWVKDKFDVRYLVESKAPREPFVNSKDVCAMQVNVKRVSSSKDYKVR